MKRLLLKTATYSTLQAYKYSSSVVFLVQSRKAAALFSGIFGVAARRGTQEREKYDHELVGRRYEQWRDVETGREKRGASGRKRRTHK